MWPILAMNVIQGFAGYNAASAQAKAKEKWQAYQNTMLQLSNAQSQNAITDNEIMAQQAFADQGIGIQKSNILTSAKAEVSAAAAGVKGRSVDQAMLDINRNAAAAERQRQIDFANSNLAFTAQRAQSSMSAAMQQDYSYIPKPKLGSYLLEAAADTYSFAKGDKAKQSAGSGGNLSWANYLFS